VPQLGKRYLDRAAAENAKGGRLWSSTEMHMTPDAEEEILK